MASDDINLGEAEIAMRAMLEAKKASHINQAEKLLSDAANADSMGISSRKAMQAQAHATLALFYQGELR